MRFYYENYSGDSGCFTLKKTEIPKAIMSAWNIEADLYIIDKKFDEGIFKGRKLIFAPHEDNEFNNEVLKEYGLYITDGEKYRELRYLEDDSLAEEPDTWSNVLDLI